jgi:NAD(P)-dependent dehydrogenase (short-subunit alcohol dehydrogenase family)
MTRTWLITGASRGIGAAIARAAVADGDRVALVARSADVEALAEELGPDAHAIRADLAVDGGAEAAVEAALELVGPPDVLVNNAAVHRGGRLERLLDGDFETVIATDLIAPFRVCRAVLPRMPEGAAVVNIGAVVGFRGFPGDSPYGAAKAGLAGLTTVLAIELAPRRITVNLVVPGFTLTDMTLGLDEQARERIVRRIPLRRTAEPDEIASVVTWVSRTPYMTGAIVPVDGGLMAALGGT